MDITAVADPCSVFAVRIARPCRSARTVTSPPSTPRLAMGGLMDHSASLFGEPDESTAERLLRSFTSIVTEVGVTVTAAATNAWATTDVASTAAKNSATRTGAARNDRACELGDSRNLRVGRMRDRRTAPAKRFKRRLRGVEHRLL